MIGSPRIGWVFRYSYLWADDRQAGAEEGAKDRAWWIVGVASITHSPPIDAAAAIEISAATNVSASGLIRTVLDRLRRSESVRLAGPRPATGAGTLPGEWWYGPLPPKLTAAVRTKLLELARTRHLKQAPRTL